MPLLLKSTSSLLTTTVRYFPKSIINKGAQFTPIRTIFNAGQPTSTSVYELSAKTLTGEEFPFTNLKDKVVLIVNVASECGFASQYEGLEKLFQEKKDQGFTVLAFPCNQFGNQEPGTNEDIAKFTREKYGVTFPIMEKIDVNGGKTHPIYEYLKSKKPGIMGIPLIKWNFEKFLLDKKGAIYQRYASTADPDKIKGDVEALL